MTRTAFLSSLFLLGAVAFVAGQSAGTQAEAPKVPAPRANAPRILVFTKTAGFRHDSIPQGIACVRELALEAEKTLFDVDATEDSDAFTMENLAKYRAVVFLSTSGDILDEAQQAAFEAWVKAGGGYVGIHAAADTEHTWPFYGELVGAWFRTHPPVQKATVVVEDRNHPSTSMLPERWERTDEWYVWKENPRGSVHVLASLDESTYNAAEAAAMGDHPIAWCHDVGKGRSWYTGGGHTKESFQEPLFRMHILGGIKWALRLDPNDVPTPLPTPKPPQPKSDPSKSDPSKGDRCRIRRRSKRSAKSPSDRPSPPAADRLGFLSRQRSPSVAFEGATRGNQAKMRNAHLVDCRCRRDCADRYAAYTRVHSPVERSATRLRIVRLPRRTRAMTLADSHRTSRGRMEKPLAGMRRSAGGNGGSDSTGHAAHRATKCVTIAAMNARAVSRSLHWAHTALPALRCGQVCITTLARRSASSGTWPDRMACSSANASVASSGPSMRAMVQRRSPS
ncbi:MAG: ThuA domain-containing protein [Phycisphaerae bacterium]|nr:ThuA domain-containing protein [Phycisphaerae bacterium]